MIKIQRICKYCGKKYEGDRGSSACAECVVAVRKNVIRPRICRTCGITFDGGPRAWYCPNCRAERMKNAWRESEQRKKLGNTRKIGSIGICETCNNEYTITSGNQKYCKNCAKINARDKKREISSLWDKKYRPPQKRREIINNAIAEINCVICGALFKPVKGSLTCSENCLKKYKSEYAKQRRKQKK